MAGLTFLPVDEGDVSRVKIDSVEEQILREREYFKEQALRTRGILNKIERQSDVPDKLIYSDGMMYAFVWWHPTDEKDLDKVDASWKYYGLWCCPVGDMHIDGFTEVSDLTGVAVFTYQRLRKIAIAIGWIDEDDK